MNDMINLAERLAPQRGREARRQSLATRFTEAEEKTLAAAAKASGKTVREWSREVLLREAGRTDDVLLTETVATRMLLVNLLQPLAQGLKLTPEAITGIMANVRRDKHKAARDVKQQYTAQEPKELPE